MRTDTQVTFFRKDYAPPSHLIEQVDLRINLHDTATRVVNKMTFARNSEGSDSLFLNGKDLTFISASLNGNAISPVVTAEGVTIDVAGLKTFEVEIETEINPEANTSFEGIYKSNGMFCSQCEAESFRRITYFLDRPDILSRYTVRVEGDKAQQPYLLSNGNIPHETGDLPGGRHYAVYRDDTPKPCYLFAIGGGKLHYLEDNFITASGRNVRLRVYVDTPEKVARCAWAMDSLKRAMKWDEEKWGREYQYDRFDIVAISKFNMGAMENTTLNYFNDSLILADPESATDADYGAIEAVVAHEYFHNWTGNRITCRDWFQLTLKEGLTVFRDQEFSSDMNSRAVERIDMVKQLRDRQFTEDSGPLSHPIRPDSYIEMNNFYTATVYEKGAEVIRMEKTLAEGKTPGSFRAGSDIYFNTFDGQAVTCEDWVDSVAKGSGVDFSAFMNWYAQSGTPEVTANFKYDDKTGVAELTLSQKTKPTPGQATKKPFHIPVAFGLLDADGNDLIGTQILELKTDSQTFSFPGIKERPVPSILRNFSAPVTLKANVTDEDLCFLMVHDTDGFNKWESGQQFFQRTICWMMDQKINTPPALFMDAVGKILDDALAGKGDPALIAYALTLPSISSVGQGRLPIDPDEIHGVIQSISREIARVHGQKLISLYDRMDDAGVYQQSGEAAGKRALRNLLLHYLDHPAMAKRQYDHATNMTDRIQALSVLVKHNAGDTQDALADFYRRFQGNHLALHKWFRVQAVSTAPGTLANIERLAAHPDFDFEEPNRVRSLYGALTVNPLMLHDRSGEGYRILKDGVIKLDTLNPQIAARMVGGLLDWKNYTHDRQRLMVQALRDIAALPNLSRNVGELVGKSLEAAETSPVAPTYRPG